MGSRVSSRQGRQSAAAPRQMMPASLGYRRDGAAPSLQLLQSHLQALQHSQLPALLP